MEMRSLTRCLRSRPTTTTTSLLSTGQPKLGHNQFLITRQTPHALCFSSSSPNSNDNTPSPPSRSQHLRPKSTANIDEILNQLNLSGNRQSRQTGQNSSNAGLSPGRAARDATFSDPRTPSSFPRQERRKVDIKLGPTLGRQVPVAPERGHDVESSLRRLHYLVNENNVRVQSIQQKYHVRRGQVRKNLKIKRWRSLFKYSFSHTVNKIQRMRRQGW